MVNEHFARRVWISVGIIVASIGLAAGLMDYFSQTLSAQANIITSDRAGIQERNNAIENLAALEAGARQAAPYQAAINQLLPGQYGLVTFTQWLSQLGTKDGVAADAVFQGAIDPPAGTSPGTAQFTFNAEGPPNNLIAFLDDMNARSSGFLISLSSFDVTNDGTNEKMTGQGVVFFR